MAGVCVRRLSRDPVAPNPPSRLPVFALQAMRGAFIGSEIGTVDACENESSRFRAIRKTPHGDRHTPWPSWSKLLRTCKTTWL